MIKPLILFTTFIATSCFDMNGLVKLDDERYKQCVQQSDYQFDEAESFNFKNPPTLELLCLMKCVAEAFEILDTQGNIAEENLMRFDEEFPEEKFPMFVDCVKDAPKVETCQDMDYFLQCLGSL